MFERGDVAVLDDGEQRGADAVLPHDVGLRRKAVADVGDVADVDDRAVDYLDRQVVELVRRSAGCRSCAMSYSSGADLRRAGGQDQVLRADGVDDVAGRQAARLQLGDVDIDHDLALLAAVGIGNGRALDGGQARRG